MIRVHVDLILIITTAFCASNVFCSTKRNEATSLPNRFMNVTARRVAPTTLLVSWRGFENEEFANVTIQFRQEGQNDWLNSFINYTDSDHRHYLTAVNLCTNYEIRLRISVDQDAQEKYYVSETTNAFAPQIPKRFESMKPVVSKNAYVDQTESIDLEFFVRHNPSSWPFDPRHLTANVHVAECGRPSSNGEDTFIGPVPGVEWSSDWKGTIRFPKEFVSIVQSGQSCQIMISIMHPTKICGRAVKTDGELLDNSVIVDMNCRDTQNMNCVTEELKHKVPSPRCDPQFVDASQIAATDEQHQKSVQLQLRWDFDKNDSSDAVTPEKIILRYGYTDVSATADPLFVFLVPMREIEKFEVHGRLKNTTIRTNVSASAPNLDPPNGQRFHRISICAVYGNDSDSDERKINWAIIPTFVVKMARNDSKPKENRCSCDDLVTYTPSSKLADSVKDVHVAVSTTSVPTVVSSPAHTYENFWSKAAPLLVVFVIMTIINIVLLMATCYYYKRAKSLNALK